VCSAEGKVLECVQKTMKIRMRKLEKSSQDEYRRLISIFNDEIP
jgi:hypothetical protein